MCQFNPLFDYPPTWYRPTDRNTRCLNFEIKIQTRSVFTTTPKQTQNWAICSPKTEPASQGDCFSQNWLQSSPIHGRFSPIHKMFSKWFFFQSGGPFSQNQFRCSEVPSDIDRTILIFCNQIHFWKCIWVLKAQVFVCECIEGYWKYANTVCKVQLLRTPSHINQLRLYTSLRQDCNLAETKNKEMALLPTLRILNRTYIA